MLTRGGASREQGVHLHFARQAVCDESCRPWRMERAPETAGRVCSWH